MFWADIVFVMSVDQKIHLKHKFGESLNEKVFVLNIEDNFAFMEPDLVKYLEASMEHLTPEVEEFLKTKGTK